MTTRTLLMSVAELKRHLSKGTVVVADARMPTDYIAGHIPGAVLLNGVFDYIVTKTNHCGLEELHHFLAKLFGNAGIKRNALVVFYDEEIGMRCARGLWMLQYAGHENVCVLDGGLAAWTETGGLISTEPANPTPTEFTVEPRPEFLATAEDILEKKEQSGFTILDVRSEEEFAGEFRQDCCARSGRIPNAVPFAWDRALKGSGFKMLDVLRNELESIGVTLDQEITTYCHRGARSANTWLMLKLLGYPKVRNYIGSWHEWSNRIELPIE